MKEAAAAGTAQYMAEYAKSPCLHVTFLRKDIWGFAWWFCAGVLLLVLVFQCCQKDAEGPFQALIAGAGLWLWLEDPGWAEVRERFGMWSRASYRRTGSQSAEHPQKALYAGRSRAFDYGLTSVTYAGEQAVSKMLFSSILSLVFFMAGGCPDIPVVAR